MLIQRQITERFIECHNELKNKEKIKSSRQFALALGCLPQSLNEILKGRRDVTIELLQKAVVAYELNPTFIMSGLGAMFAPNSAALELFSQEQLIAPLVSDIKRQLQEIREILSEQTELIVRLNVKLQQLTDGSPSPDLEQLEGEFD